MLGRLNLLTICLLVAGVALADEPLAESLLRPEVAARELSSALRIGIGGIPVEPTGQLIPHEGWHEAEASASFAILIPGMLATDDSMTRIRQALSRNNIATATFQYADQLPIETVAAGLIEVLVEWKREHPQRSISLVTHSLGGIIARTAIESAPASTLGVKRLIMIAPPNDGSALALLSTAEFSECMKSIADHPIDLSILDESLDGFFGKAKESLEPGSALLTSLNVRPRAEGVRYTIIAGTGGPIHREWIELPLLVSDLLLGSSPEQRKATAPMRRLLSTDEWMHGLGDGVVSVKSARLHQVDDFAVFPFGHNDFGSQPLPSERREAVAQAVRLIVQRIKQTDN